MSSRPLSHAEALQLLGGVALGRIAFTIDALPAILPVNHIVDQGAVIVRGHRGMEVVLKAAAGNVVAYSADKIDPSSYVGWSVTLTGVAKLIDRPAELARYPSIIQPRGIREQDYVIRIHPQIITGVELRRRPDELSTSAVPR
jgi:nitroimidazol reductase NimA-like FMN-containing flavoprotein (pyridoxamine 5'-phosphate oxidase superfamily)